MSNAKWQRLFAALEPLKRVLAFRRKDIDEEDHKVSWNTDLYEMFGLAEMIEWLEVRAKVSVQEEHSLRWIVDDHTTTLIDALREIHATSPEPGDLPKSLPGGPIP